MTTNNTTQTFNFAYAPKPLKAYAKEVLHMSPKQYSFSQFANDANAIEYTLANSKRTETVFAHEVNEWYSGR